VAGQVGFMGVIEENGKPTILAARLKVADGKISEIDHLVIHGDQPLNPNMARPRPGLVQPLEPSERLPRQQMLKIANSYYDAIVQDDGTVAPFADECQRRENGGTSANDQEQTPEEAAQDDFSVFRKMKCGEQLSTGVMSYITDINRRPHVQDPWRQDLRDRGHRLRGQARHPERLGVTRSPQPPGFSPRPLG
jgi:hypothetical protein